jgi:DNA-directed RNA polymerase subunit K/omega
MVKKSVKKEDSEDESYDEIDNNNTETNNEEFEDELDDDSDKDDDTDDDDDDKKITNDTETNDCLIEDVIDDDNEFFDNNQEVEVTSEHGTEYLSKENRISVNRLTKYEMVRILGERTKQLTMGAKPLIKNYQHLSYDKVAEEEFIRNIIPYKIKRPLPNGKYEIWTLDELNKDHLLSQLSV